MKTNRLYYNDAYQKTFTARIIERLRYTDCPAVVLDQTAFYPTGGGQPNDLGTLDNVPVVDVVEREADKAVLHVLSAEIASDTVTGQLDWPRRLDHMQQHTGQHILSQAFIQTAQAETVGFHLSQDVVTIDLNRTGLSPAVIDQVEDLANRVVFEDRPVTARFVSPDELARLPLRKPPKVEENIRIVHVDGFDWSACGGTHVSSAGQIGLIKIVRLERRGAETRVEFCCGQRALADYRRKNAMLGQVTADLSIGYWELDAAIARLQAEAKDTHKKLADAEKKLMLYEADELAAQARDMGAFAVIGHVWDGRDANALRLVAHKLIARPRTVVLLGSSGVKRSALLFARSADVDADMAAWLRQAAERLGGKGGGGPDMAQGGGGPADASQVQAALEWVVEAMVKT